MKLEYKVWNIHKNWQPMRASTLSGAEDELARGDPYNEEAIVRDVDSGKVYKRSQLVPRTAKAEVIHGMNCDCCPRWF